MQNLLLVAAWMSLALATAGASRADDAQPQPHHHLQLHRHNDSGTPPPGKPRSIPHSDHRAGNPRYLAGHLEPSVTAGGIGSYVGGGVCLGAGDPRRRDEGTWGWDETGSHRFRRRGILGWSHGRRYQGGTGSYVTVGPQLPDPIFGATSTIKRLHRGTSRE
jgi:hypothetical protein